MLDTRHAAAAMALVAALWAAPAAPARAQDLAVGSASVIGSLDPHFYNVGPNNAVAATLFDRMLESDAQARVHPGLLLSWSLPAPEVWEFRLRPGVRFHNGAEFTAEDIAFTIARLPTIVNSPGSFTTYTRAIQAVEVVDPLTVRIRTSGPYPNLLVDLARIVVLNRRTHEGATTEDFNAGRAAVGTGPYRLVEHRPGDRILMARNDSYWGDKPRWQRVDYRMVTNDAARTAALLAGDLDAIEQVPTSDIARLRRDPRVALSEVESLRNAFLVFDHSRDGPTPFVTDHEGRPLPRNPFKDRRVREALSLAIDRQAIVERVMEGSASASMQFVGRGVFGHVPDLAPPRPDPDAARRLLAEAGYPNGFRLALHTPNDRYPNDAKTSQAVGQMWTRIGVRTQVEAMPFTSFIGRAGRQEFSVWYASWGSSTGETSGPLRSTLATFDRARGLGAVNRGRYSNPEFDARLLAAMREMDAEKREQTLQEAMRFVMEDHPIVPLLLFRNVWAMRRGIAHTPRADELTRPQDFR
ncbi:ABC transporter substrate-binding protein [Caldovatus aquaticus]|uniref:ABC transporter substrate-binding protein n=1 Tax=Caldovatus aquaticus TaxID=2865671 RepID=A0ABS7F4H3_9PROT|nr:ABC transporter substrate-binding protein [Caldovatus aquaticus]MBW8270193.1 ABC transporter substrate-binding protein [Caldovatus aquaticus]